MWSEALDHWGEAIVALDKMGKVLREMGETELLGRLVDQFGPMCFTVAFGAPLAEVDAFDARQLAAKEETRA
jgi:hypothetical protein